MQWFSTHEYKIKSHLKNVTKKTCLGSIPLNSQFPGLGGSGGIAMCLTPPGDSTVQAKLKSSKCGPWTSGISITWGHVGNANDRAPAWNQKLWGWSPAVCIPVRLPGTSDACLTLRPLLYPAQSSQI